MAKRKDLIGRRFGKLTVVEKTDQLQDNYRVWKCRCDCGGEICVNTKRLMRGTVRDCGCVPKENARRGNVAEDLTGRRFGSLTVIRRGENKNGRTAWVCKCDCGNEKTVTAHDLKAGKVKSCGCRIHEHEHNRVDLTGRRFGRLKALYPTEQRDRRGSVYWHCVCDCGNETDVTAAGLVHGNYRSCGCLKSENQKNISKQLHMVDGTCVEILEKRKHRRDNTSGFRGVYQLKNKKYRVDIGFKGKRFYLGCFEDYDQAVAARLNAERLIHEGFCDAWHKWKAKADSDPAWASANPLIFNVDKKNGSLDITTEVPAR